jgi:hypothetical protein
MVRRWLFRRLWQLLEWLTVTLARLEGQPVAEPAPPDPLILFTKLAVEQAQQTKHTGAFRAVIVLKALKARFPERRTRDLRLAIERAVQELP